MLQYCLSIISCNNFFKGLLCSTVSMKTLWAYLTSICLKPINACLNICPIRKYVNRKTTQNLQLVAIKCKSPLLDEYHSYRHWAMLLHIVHVCLRVRKSFKHLSWSVVIPVIHATLIPGGLLNGRHRFITLMGRQLYRKQWDEIKCLNGL